MKQKNSKLKLFIGQEENLFFIYTEGTRIIITQEEANELLCNQKWAGEFRPFPSRKSFLP